MQGWAGGCGPGRLASVEPSSGLATEAEGPPTAAVFCGGGAATWAGVAAACLRQAATETASAARARARLQRSVCVIAGLPTRGPGRRLPARRAYDQSLHRSTRRQRDQALVRQCVRRAGFAPVSRDAF